MSLTLLCLLENNITQALKKAFPELAPEHHIVDVTQSTSEKFGHYQCNSPMKLTKLLRKNPRVVAEELLAALERNAPNGEAFIAHAEIAGPGFINITLDARYLAKCVQAIIFDPRLGISLPEKPEKIIVEFSSPNTAKEMHVGHLRSTIIGDSLARLFEFLGYDVLRLNHIGDWGTSFGMLIAYMKEEVPEVLSGEVETDLDHLVLWYKASKQRFDELPEFKKRAQLEVVALQGGEPFAFKAWEKICHLSRIAYQQIYDLLDIKIVERGESFYNPMLAEVVSDLEKKGLVTISDGAKCVFLEGFQNREGEMLPLMVQKSDGGYNYATTDLAAIRQRAQVERARRIIYVTDAGQSTHFQMIFKCAEKAGYFDPAKVHIDHVTFGLVLGSDGKKFKTRSGDTEKLIDLLSAAIEQAREILHERDPSLNEEELTHLAKVLGISAVKYADLSCNRNHDYVFSYDRMLRFEGNTAAFIMYAYVRVAGIKRKVKMDPESIKETPISLQHPSEVCLGLHLCQFGEVLECIERDLLPNRLTDYLYVLAEKFNAFFRDCRVEGVPEQNGRLLLCEAVARTLQRGMQILGLETVDRM